MILDTGLLFCATLYNILYLFCYGVSSRLSTLSVIFAASRSTPARRCRTHELQAEHFTVHYCLQKKATNYPADLLAILGSRRQSSSRPVDTIWLNLVSGGARSTVPELFRSPVQLRGTLWDATAHRTVHQNWARKACLPMFSSICLELIISTRHQQRLFDDHLNLGWKLIFSV